MFFVSGITGKVGGATARRLLAEGRAVRALARNPEKAAEWANRGVDVRQGDLNNPESVADALEGVEGAFLMIPPAIAPSPGYFEAKATISSFAEALRRMPPLRLILLSSFGSEKDHGLGNITTTHLMESALGDFPFPTAFIRAGGFYENYSGQLGMVNGSGILHSFYAPTNRAVPMVATVDIGSEIARLLMEGWSGKKIVELGTLVSPDEIAGAMSEALGRPVEAQPIPREGWSATLQSVGLPPGATGSYEEMMDGINTGWIDFGAPGAELVPGTTPASEVFTRIWQARMSSAFSRVD